MLRSHTRSFLSLFHLCPSLCQASLLNVDGFQSAQVQQAQHVQPIQIQLQQPVQEHDELDALPPSPEHQKAAKKALEHVFNHGGFLKQKMKGFDYHTLAELWTLQKVQETVNQKGTVEGVIVLHREFLPRLKSLYAAHFVVPDLITSSFPLQEAIAVCSAFSKLYPEDRLWNNPNWRILFIYQPLTKTLKHLYAIGFAPLDDLFIQMERLHALLVPELPAISVFFRQHFNAKVLAKTWQKMALPLPYPPSFSCLEEHLTQLCLDSYWSKQSRIVMPMICVASIKACQHSSKNYDATRQVFLHFLEGKGAEYSDDDDMFFCIDGDFEKFILDRCARNVLSDGAAREILNLYKKAMQLNRLAVFLCRNPAKFSRHKALLTQMQDVLLPLSVADMIAMLNAHHALPSTLGVDTLPALILSIENRIRSL